MRVTRHSDPPLGEGLVKKLTMAAFLTPCTVLSVRRRAQGYLGVQLTSCSLWNTAERSSDSTTEDENEGPAFGNTRLSGTGVDDLGTMTSLWTDGVVTVRFR